MSAGNAPKEKGRYMVADSNHVRLHVGIKRVATVRPVYEIVQ